MVLLIISVVCFLVLFKTLKSLESKEWEIHEVVWKPVKLAIWIWILIIIGCLIPAVNVFITVILLVVIFIGTRVGDLRFKGGKETWLDKLIDFLNKEI